MKSKQKFKIVKRCYTVAIDENNESYPIKNYPYSYNKEEIIYEGVEGVIEEKTEPIYYDDGTMSRSIEIIKKVVISKPHQLI